MSSSPYYLNPQNFTLVMNKTEGTPSKVDPPLNTGQLPATPVSNVQNNFNYPAQMTTHSNPNTPMNQRTQRIQNQPKFSTPQPGRPNHQQNWHQNVSFPLFKGIRTMRYNHFLLG